MSLLFSIRKFSPSLRTHLPFNIFLCEFSIRSLSYHPAFKCLKKAFGIHILINSHSCFEFAGKSTVGILQPFICTRFKKYFIMLYCVSCDKHTSQLNYVLYSSRRLNYTADRKSTVILNRVGEEEEDFMSLIRMCRYKNPTPSPLAL